jgi:hypothetical protein
MGEIKKRDMNVNKRIEDGLTGQRGVLFLAADEHLDQAGHQALAVLERLLRSKK